MAVDMPAARPMTSKDACTLLGLKGPVGGDALKAAFRSAAMQWWTRRRIARLSDRMLRDFGFERDWDGSIRSLRDLD